MSSKEILHFNAYVVMHCHAQLLVTNTEFSQRRTSYIVQKININFIIDVRVFG
jgi:hypothetical protein